MSATIDQPGYVSPAFYSQYNLILLAGSALFSAASASAVPLAVGLLAEACWLGLAPQLPVFRRSVDSRLEAERRQQLDDEVMSGMRALDPQQSSRLLGLGQVLSMFTMHAEDVRDPELLAAARELEQLRPVFMRLCQLQRRLASYLQELEQRPPEQEVARLSQAYAAEKDLGARLTLHQSIKLEQRKIEQKTRLLEASRNIELKLSLIEQSLQHLRGQQQIGANGAALARDARGLVTQVGDSAGLEAEVSELARP
jgi:hypothetical protein